MRDRETRSNDDVQLKQIRTSPECSRDVTSQSVKGRAQLARTRTRLTPRRAHIVQTRIQRLSIVARARRVQSSTSVARFLLLLPKQGSSERRRSSRDASLPAPFLRVTSPQTGQQNAQKHAELKQKHNLFLSVSFVDISLCRWNSRPRSYVRTKNLSLSARVSLSLSSNTYQIKRISRSCE